jgi:hypothetical protein
MNLFKISTVALALALTGWVACGSSSNNSPDVASIGTGGAIGTGGVVATGGIVGTGGTVGIDGPVGTGGAVGMDAAVADAGSPDAPIGPIDVGMDGPALDTASADAQVTISDAAAGETGPGPDICTGLTPQQCHLAIINAPVDPTVTPLDPIYPAPPVAYPLCAAQ